MSCVYVPKDTHGWFTDQVLSYSTGWYYDDQWGKVTSCDEVDHLPTVRFLLKGKDGNDYWAEWLPEDYLVEIGDY